MRDFDRKERGESPVYSGIVVIEPCKGFWSKKFGEDCRGIYVTACQGLKREPVTEFGLAGLAAENNVFMPDAVAAFAVEARLIGCDHSRKQRLGIGLITNTLRAFVNAEIVAYAVTGALTKIASSLP